MPFFANAQVMVDTFDSNQYGWTETTMRGGLGIIKDGVLRIESKTQMVTVTCYAPFDFNKPFTMSVDALADKISGTIKSCGLLFDYEDDRNYIKFALFDDHSVLERVVGGQVVAHKEEDLKLGKGENVGFHVEVEYSLSELLFRVNGVKALTYRRRLPDGHFLLGTSGIGFYSECSSRSQKVSYDNLIIEQ